jgi:glutamate racemase
MLEAAVAPAIKVIDSAEATASQAARLLAGHARGYGETLGARRCSFFATDSVAKFRRLGARFLGGPIDEVELVDLGG